MRNKISAIIIDGDYLHHDYSGVKSESYFAQCEKYFELKLLDSDKDIKQVLSNFRGVDSIITIGGDYRDYSNMNMLPFAFRKLWVHFETFNCEVISKAIVSTFLQNINRRECPKLFSIFTCTYRTGKEKLERLYNSLLNQTYPEWNWFILDDSNDNGETVEILNSFNDPRITIIQNITNHGSIGFNKHTIAMMCDGDYLVEVDHDDELSVECLEYLLKAFQTFPDTDFAYSLAVEYVGPNLIPIVYGEFWGHGEGLTKTEIINGKETTFSASPNINPYTIRTIYAMPNHVRCWKKEFYHMIGGHNTSLSVLDDMDIMIRTFLCGRMTKIDKALYFQYEGEGERGVNDDNTQSKRFGEIQRTVWLLKSKYDLDIHNRILELGFNDPPWNDETHQSFLDVNHEKDQNVMNNILFC